MNVPFQTVFKSHQHFLLCCFSFFQLYLFIYFAVLISVRFSNIWHHFCFCTVKMFAAEVY